MVRRLGGFATGVAVSAYAGSYVLGRYAGTTARERRARLPGDGLVARPTLATDHALTIDAPPEAVWPWLTQMGWHLGGYYTPRWVDKLLFPANWPSLDQLDPALVRNLAVGDVIPDGEPGTAWFVVAEVEAPNTLVLHSTTHLPASWRDRLGAHIDWTWTFRLIPLPARRTRLHLRVRGRTAPWLLTAAYHAVLVPADLVMAMGMLHGIKQRAESGRPATTSGRAPVTGVSLCGGHAEPPAHGGTRLDEAEGHSRSGAGPIDARNVRWLQRFDRWLYKGGRPNALARVLNRAATWQFSSGTLAPSNWVTLEVAGRRSGRLISVPLVVTDLEGDRYLVAMLGDDVNWVRNVRAAGMRAVLRHGRREAVRLTDVDVAARPPILRRYLRLAPGARAHLPVDRRAPLRDFARIAAVVPVFRIHGDVDTSGRPGMPADGRGEAAR